MNSREQKWYTHGEEREWNTRPVFLCACIFSLQWNKSQLSTLKSHLSILSALSKCLSCSLFLLRVQSGTSVSTTDTRYRSWPFLNNFRPNLRLPDLLPYWSVFFFLIFLFTFSISLYCCFFSPCSHPNFSSLCLMIPWVALLCTITMYLVLLPKCQSFLILLIQTVEIFFLQLSFERKPTTALVPLVYSKLFK